MIDEIPEKEKGIKVMSDLEKVFYKKFLKERYEKILLPSYERIVNSSQPFIRLTSFFEKRQKIFKVFQYL